MREDRLIYCLSGNMQVRDAAQAIDPGLVAMACGSYRRGKATCGDVDVLITHPDGQSHRGIFSQVLQSLHGGGKLGLLNVEGIILQTPFLKLSNIVLKGF